MVRARGKRRVEPGNVGSWRGKNDDTQIFRHKHTDKKQTAGLAQTKKKQEMKVTQARQTQADIHISGKYNK